MVSTSVETPAELDNEFGPFHRDEFQADLIELAELVRADARRWATQAVLTARLAAQVPAENRSVREGTLWKSFVREVAVARRCSDQAAAKEIFLAVSLVRSFPRALALLADGQLPLYHARVLLEESAGCDDAVIALVDDELSDRACRLTPSRIRDAVRKLELRLDADAAAARSAKATAGRNIRIVADRDDQATLVISGPARPVVQFYEAVNAAARAAREAGDPRTLDALRFDIATDIGQPTDPDTTDPESTGPDTTDPDTTGPESTGPDTGPESTGPESTEREGTGPAPAVQPGWTGDRRRVRPVQILLHLPVTTALGLDNEPGWLPGYGWISAPQCRQWLTQAELRQVCVATVNRPGFVGGFDLTRGWSHGSTAEVPG